MTISNNNDLALSRYEFRFLSPQAEADYRAWSIEDRLPSIRMAGWVAMFVWGLSPLVVWLAFPDDIRTILIASVIMVPTIAVALVTSFILLLRPLVMPVSAGVLSLSAFVATWMGYTLTGAVGGASVGMMMAILYSPLMRITTTTCMTALLPPVLYCIYLVIQNPEPGIDFGIISYFYSGFPSVALFAVAVVNFMDDRRSRVAYQSERVIDRQKNSLEHTQGLIRRYIPPAVAEQIITGNEASIDQPKRQRVTVLFCDIVGFTDIADRVEPEVMTEVLNEYMSCMADLIEAHGGTLNEFAGDGLMALFGAPDAMPPEDQARSPIEAAQAMQAKMPELNEQWRKLGLGAELTTRIGINTGMVSVGSYGSQGRMTYTAIGLQTNIASRIESKAEPGQVLISDATYQLVSDTLNCEPKGEVECKGVHFPVKVYAPSMKQ